MIASPLTRIITSGSSAAAANPAAATTPCPTQVLLIARETNEQNRLTAYLNNIFSVLPARNGRDMIKTLQSHPIQLVIIDIGPHPSEDLQLCTELKTSPDYGHIPILLLMSPGSARFRIKYLKSGADALLEKPFSQTCLKAQAANLVANRIRIKDFFASSQPATTPQPDCSFTKKLEDLIAKNLSNPSLDVNLLARLMNMSRPTFYRKVNSTSTIPPNEMINTARLEKAARLLSTTGHAISEIAGLAGFHSRSAFGKSFQKHFRLTPTAFRKNAS
ncbi:MAG: DNA-binding response regulator [Bacteroidetes bacterium]|nr:DNA-binding response regulator [Bacteroidota bacterium]